MSTLIYIYPYQLHFATGLRAIAATARGFVAREIGASVVTMEIKTFESFDGQVLSWRETGQGRAVVLIHG